MLIFAYLRNRTMLIVVDRLLVTISNYEQLSVTMNVTDRLSNPDYMLPTCLLANINNLD